MQTQGVYPLPLVQGKPMVDLARAARLRQARETAGYARAVDAAIAFGWNRSTYFSHENGSRGISRDRIDVYSTAFRVRADWLAYAHGPARIGSRRIRIEGEVGNHATIGERENRLAEPDEIELPEGINPADFVAFRVRDDTNYPEWQNRDVILAQRTHGPPQEYVGRRCLVTLDDGTRLIRTLLRGTRDGLFVLLSHREPPMLDVAIRAAAPIAWTKHGG